VWYRLLNLNTRKVLILGRVARWLLLAATLLLVALPRFNLGDPGVIHNFTLTARATRYGLPLDVAGYVRLVEYYRGTTPADSLIPPYCYRPAVPFIASTLPFDPLTSINLINLVCLFLSVLVLDRILRRIGYGVGARTAGELMSIISFPTFYYGTIGFVDPVAVLAITLGIFLTLRGERFLLFVCLVLGTLAKETNAVIALLPGIWGWVRGWPRRRIAVQFALLVAAALVTAFCARALSPYPERGWFLAPQPRIILENLSRPRALLSLGLTLGLPALFSLVAAVRGGVSQRLGRQLLQFFVAGAGTSVVLYLYSLVGAWADGRVIWIIYPFLIPVALTLWWSPGSERSLGLPSGRSAT
jgi:hypothetical protein